MGLGFQASAKLPPSFRRVLTATHSCRRKDASTAPAAVPYLLLFNPSFPINAMGQDSGSAPGMKVWKTLRCQDVASYSITSRIPPIAHEGKSDLDPSEWKPHPADRSSSEAFRYLGQFHRSPASVHPVRRPMLQTRGTPASAAFTTPSLSHTPATSTSSGDSIAGTPYEFVTRPLLPRLDPKYSTSGGMKSVDLVTPHASLTMGASTSEMATNSNSNTYPTMHTKASGGGVPGDVSFEKKRTVQRRSTAVGSLKQLLEIGKSSGTTSIPSD